jgi:hypothetical protein
VRRTVDQARRIDIALGVKTGGTGTADERTATPPARPAGWWLVSER